MTRVRRRLCLLVLLPVLQLTGLGAADAAILACGATITTDTVLENDVGPCETGGLIIGANNITLDLNGHQVFGRPGPTDGVGILLTTRTGVTVRNGTVHNFDGGVVIDGGSNNRVLYITARDNIGRSSISRAGDGIAIESSRNNLIFGNNAANNGPFSGIGLYTLVDGDHPRVNSGVSSGNVIDSNTVVNNVISRSGGLADTDNDGVRVENNSVGNTFVNNRVTGNGLDGIALFRGAGQQIIRYNIVNRNGLFRSAARRGTGIISFNQANNNLIEHNLVTNNGDNGISLRPTVTVASGVVPGSMNNIVRNNTAVGNVARPYIPSRVFGPTADLHDGNPDCDNNQWQDNRYGTVNPPCAGDMP